MCGSTGTVVSLRCSGVRYGAVRHGAVRCGVVVRHSGFLGVFEIASFCWGMRDRLQQGRWCVGRVRVLTTVRRFVVPAFLVKFFALAVALRLRSMRLCRQPRVFFVNT